MWDSEREEFRFDLKGAGDPHTASCSMLMECQAILKNSSKGRLPFTSRHFSSIDSIPLQRKLSLRVEYIIFMASL